ncbi:SIR2 family protein [Mesorhizobium sp.]|uniref:SIR2 family protein n=1 Tax=Mesorhizobium sp. TaxID=1871066 RepID=UPI0025DB07F5|nr:SIR2 family protein [Mesorhizobium sp.]
MLLFGSGSSIPSGAPSVPALQHHFESVFHVSAETYNLAEQSGIIEQRTKDRRSLIESLQKQFHKLRPTGALLNLPLYNWKSIYTTNYDELIESAYRRRERPLRVYSTNFDFSKPDDQADATELMKLHGTISKDVSLGDRSRIILTDSDYDLAEEFREQLFDRLKTDIGNSHLVIIGHSLSDPDIRNTVQRALNLKSKSGFPVKISLFLYTRDDGRAELFEARGIEVVFGGLDDFFAGLVGRIEPSREKITSPDPLDHVTALRPSTQDVGHALESQPPNVAAMYNGRPATYGDIKHALTFRRVAADRIVTQFRTTEKFVSVILGPSGVGKTTAARQTIKTLVDNGLIAWEHLPDQPFLPRRWNEVADFLAKNSQTGVLFVDDAHEELTGINTLLELLNSSENTSLKIVLASTNHNWGPRIKTPVLFKSSEIYLLNRISGTEVDKLLNLVDMVPELKRLVEKNFLGYTRHEKRVRLIQRCEADMFVCLKNIFSSEKFDDIILREFADLDPTLQGIYRVVAAMESAGVHVHRQLVIRLLGLSAGHIGSILSGLEDIIYEETVDENRGIYAWRGRHKVIMDIIAEHKYYDTEKRYDLLSLIVSSIQPSYKIEIRTIRSLCNVGAGIALIPDKEQQNVLLRKMISAAPGERVPRHRLIRNLIDLGHFDAADTEIKVFGSEFSLDAPTARYRISLAIARAVRSKRLMPEDRIALIGKAEEIAADAVARYRDVKGIIVAYCEVGIETAKLTGSRVVFDRAINLLRTAEERIGDPDIGRAIARLERRISTIALEDTEFEFEDLIDE